MAVLNAVATHELRFNEKGKFKILQLTDLHFGEDEAADLKSQNVVRQLLELEKPDFVAITGDVVSSFVWTNQEDWFEAQYGKLMSILDEQGVHFGTTAGNHDAEANLNRRQISELDRSYNYSMTQANSADISNEFNYRLSVHSK